VGQVGGDAGRVDDVVEGEVVDVRAGLEKEGEGLPNPAGSSSDDCLVAYRQLFSPSLDLA